MAETPLPAAPRIEIEYLKGFPFFWRDPGFKNNILLGSIHMLIPIVGPIVLMGWYCEIIQRLVRRHSRPIPRLDFSDFGHYLGRGVIPFVVSFLTTLPMVIVVYFGVFVFIMILAVLGEQGLVQDFVLLGIGATGGILIFFGLILPATVLINAFLTFAEITEDFGQSMNFSRAWGYAKRNWKKIITAQLVFIPVAIGGFILGMLACYFGIFPVSLMINLAFLYVRWQIYEYDLSRGGPPLPMKPERPIPSEQRVATAVAAPPPAPTV